MNSSSLYRPPAPKVPVYGKPLGRTREPFTMNDCVDRSTTGFRALPVDGQPGSSTVNPVNPPRPIIPLANRGGANYPWRVPSPEGPFSSALPDRHRRPPSAVDLHGAPEARAPPHRVPSRLLPVLGAIPGQGGARAERKPPRPPAARPAMPPGQGVALHRPRRRTDPGAGDPLRIGTG